MVYNSDTERIGEMGHGLLPRSSIQNRDRIESYLEKSELGRKILIGLRDYADENGRVDGIIVYPEVLLMLQKEDLVDEQLRTNLGPLGTYHVQNLKGTNLGLHKTRNLPVKVLQEADKLKKNMENPLILFQDGWFKRFKHLESWNLDCSLEELAQAH